MPIKLKNIIVTAEQPFLDRVLVNGFIHEVLPTDIVTVQLRSLENEISVGVKASDEKTVRPIMKANLSEKTMVQAKELALKLKDEIVDGLSDDTLDLYHRSDLTFNPCEVEVQDEVIDINFYIENYDNVIDIDWLLNQFLSQASAYH